MKTLRPWRKSTLQVVTVEHWKGLVSESQPDSSQISKKKGEGGGEEPLSFFKL